MWALFRKITFHMCLRVFSWASQCITMKMFQNPGVHFFHTSRKFLTEFHTWISHESNSFHVWSFPCEIHVFFMFKLVILKDSHLSCIHFRDLHIYIYSFFFLFAQVFLHPSLKQKQKTVYILKYLLRINYASNNLNQGSASFISK